MYAAIVVRCIAAIFSQGYGMHDDHFLIVEAAASWVDGFDYNNWLPWNKPEGSSPEGHSFTYVGLNFLLFYILKGVGIVDPKVLMLINRMVHALLSVLTVYFGFRITERLSNRSNAVTVGWLLALTFVIPFLSVRNLVEMACIPFIVWGAWLFLKEGNWKTTFCAGLVIGMAVSFRYQVGVFAIGLALYALMHGRFKQLISYCLGVLFLFCITQGLVDYLIWGYPFAEMLGYVVYNLNEGTGYSPNSNSLMYIEVLMGCLLFPLGLLMGIGYFRSAKKFLVLFLPSLLFLLFHSLYPNKQERFILPILPIFIILGVVGYHSLTKRLFWQKCWNVSLKIFWALNIPLLLVACFIYSKKSRVEAMYYFYEQDIYPKHVLVEGSGDGSTSMLPQFYAGKWDFKLYYETEFVVNDAVPYDFIIFSNTDRLAERIELYREVFPNMRKVQVCNPSLVDKIMRFLNPKNTNEYLEIWAMN